MKRAVRVFLICLLASSVGAQIVHDPNDQLYRDLDRWAVRGYISLLPPIRPYPLQLLERLLEGVVERGDAASRVQASRYLAEIAPRARGIHVGAVGSIRGEGDDLSMEGAPTIDGAMREQDWLGASYSMHVYGATREPGKEIAVPGVDSPYPDLIKDNAEVGPFKIMQNWTSAAAVGNADLYFQAGLNRTSFGPFFDNGPVVGAQAGRAGHFSAVYRRSGMTFSVLFLTLSASDDFGEGRFPDKHLILHSFDYSPFPGFEWGFFESVVWGGRFEPLYLAPFVNYFAAQSLTGFEDNSFLGFHVRWTPRSELQALAQIYIDDWNFNDMAKLKFDTRYKFASQLGLRWAPEDGLLSSLAADYTAVMPYMYTHITEPRSGADIARYVEEKPNYYNYTHLGRGLGADLDPNSDRLWLRAAFGLVDGLELRLSGLLRRHGNASEGVDGITEAYHDGSVFDDGYTDPADPSTDDPRNTFSSETRFLTQEVIETRASAGIGATYTMPTPIGDFTAAADYVFEYAWNRALVEGDDGVAHRYVFTGSWRW